MSAKWTRRNIARSKRNSFPKLRRMKTAYASICWEIVRTPELRVSERNGSCGIGKAMSFDASPHGVHIQLLHRKKQKRYAFRLACRFSFVPVRGAGRISRKRRVGICFYSKVAVPVRGAGRILFRIGKMLSSSSCSPREGRGSHQVNINYNEIPKTSCSPREGRGSHLMNLTR